MNKEQAKNKLYDELLYTVREYGGTEADLLELIDSFSYLDGWAPIFTSPEREQHYSIEQFLKEQKPVLEKYLDNLDIVYSKEVINGYVMYRLFNDALIIKPDEDKYNVNIKVGNREFITLSLLSFTDITDIIIGNKDKFQ